jgi:hypothetical protein
MPLLPPAIHPYRTPHPDDPFPLVPHCEQPLRRRFPALCLAPLLGIEPLTACDPHAHPLQTLLGRGYHRATLTPCLGPLERIDAAGARLPALGPPPVGQMADVDGPRIASWSRVPMHQGTRTMLGRLMAGSQAVITQDAAGQGLLGASHPPAQPLSPCLVASGQPVPLATGASIGVIARAVQARARARAFAPQGWGLLCLLDDHAQHGLESCAAPVEATRQDGTRGSRGPWKRPRADDPRHWGIVPPVEGKTCVYGGTPRGTATVAPTAWPQVSRERSERQEHRCKRMMDPGALHPNDGRKKMIGAERHPPRVRAPLDPALEAAQKRVEQQGKEGKTPQATVGESASTGHGKRLEQRQRTLAGLDKAPHDAPPRPGQLAAHVAAVGPPGERADRDVRPQTIMTLRPLRFEQALMSFMARLCGCRKTQVRLDCRWQLLCARSGARMETAPQVVYGITTAGFSVPYHRRLAEVVSGLGAMDLRDQGKPIQVRCKTMPPCSSSVHGQLGCPFLGRLSEVRIRV